MTKISHSKTLRKSIRHSIGKRKKKKKKKKKKKRKRTRKEEILL